jgi:cytochrome o ubiquinol oxidase subunit 3
MTINPERRDARASTTFPRRGASRTAGGATMLGFWIYLMSDALIFATLFAVYGVLSGNYAGGPGPQHLFELPLVALNTGCCWLVDHLVDRHAGDGMREKQVGDRCGCCSHHRPARRGVPRRRALRVRTLIAEGATPQRSAFLSAFFTLVARTACTCLRHDLAGDAAGPDRPARPDPPKTSAG